MIPPARFADEVAGVDAAEIVAVNQSRAFLRATATVLLPPAPVTVTVGFAEAGPFATAACPLTVALRLQRPEDLVDPDLRTPDHDGSAERADSSIPARSTVERSTCDTQTRTLSSFADAFHRACPDLRLATGAAGDADLWLVNFGPGGLTSIDIGPGVPRPDDTRVPRCFAIRPLYREPQTRRAVELPALDDDGRLTTGPTVDVQAVDVEVWARRFLSDIDRILSVSYTCGLYDDPGARLALDDLLVAKDRLTIAIAQGVAEILDLPCAPIRCCRHFSRSPPTRPCPRTRPSTTPPAGRTA